MTKFNSFTYVAGLEWNNPDILENYNKEGSYDLNDGDSDPTPNSNEGTSLNGFFHEVYGVKLVTQIRSLHGLVFKVSD